MRDQTESIDRSKDPRGLSLFHMPAQEELPSKGRMNASLLVEQETISFREKRLDKSLSRAFPTDWPCACSQEGRRKGLAVNGRSMGRVLSRTTSAERAKLLH